MIKTLQGNPYGIGIIHIVVWLCFGCGSQAQQAAKPAPLPTSVSGEPSFSIETFSVFTTATQDNALPFLAQRTNGEKDHRVCIGKTKTPHHWQTKNSRVLDNIKTNVVPIKSAILSWLEAELADGAGDYGEVISNWKVDLDGVSIRHADKEKVRMAEEQTCIDETARALDSSSTVVTTLFGATQFRFKSDSPMDKGLIKHLRTAAKKKKVKFSTVQTYKKAKDKNGRPIFKKGKPLFKAPDGTLVTKKKVPPVPKRPVFELVVEIPQGLFFAYGNMPDSVWSREFLPEQCNLNLVYDDVTPRIPECGSFYDAGFGVSPSSNGNQVIVKISADDVVVAQPVEYNTTKMIQAGGRVIVWVTPRPLEEGAVLEIDSLVLFPRDSNPENLKPFKFSK